MLLGRTLTPCYGTACYSEVGKYERFVNMFVIKLMSCKVHSLGPMRKRRRHPSKPRSGTFERLTPTIKSSKLRPITLATTTRELESTIASSAMSILGNCSGATGELDNLPRKFRLRRNNGLSQRLCGGILRFSKGEQRLLPHMLVPNAPKCTQWFVRKLTVKQKVRVRRFT
jgi:hypothetical protein